VAARHGRRSPHRLAARMVEPRCLAFRRTDPAFEPSLRQHRSPLSGNAILRGRAGAETAPEIQSTACRDKMRARIPAGSGLFAMNREISVCVRLHGGGRSHCRTCLSNKFPGSREINREFRQIQPSAAVHASSQRAKSIACRQIPCALEQGKFKWTSGKICRRTEKVILPIGFNSRRPPSS
jgi:hypothetical protein